MNLKVTEGLPPMISLDVNCERMNISLANVNSIGTQQYISWQAVTRVNQPKLAAFDNWEIQTIKLTEG